MPFPQLDRRKLMFKSLSQRTNRIVIERDWVSLDSEPNHLSRYLREKVKQVAEDVQRSRAAGKPVILAFGAHAIKNGLAPVLIRLIEDGWVTHLATNGAGIIHDWEFAYQGASSEAVRENGECG